jgi:hypothetical protein
MRISGSDISNFGILIGSGSVAVTRSSIEVNGTHIASGTTGGGSFETSGNYHTASNAAFFITASSPSGSSRNVSVTTSVFDGCRDGCVRSTSSGQFNVSGNDFRLGAGAAATWNPILFTETHALISFNKIDCVAPSSRTAIFASQFAGVGFAANYRSRLTGLLTGNAISNCNTAVVVNGNGHIFSGGSRNSGVGNTVVYSLTNGAILEADRLDGVTPHDTITGTTEVLIDTDKAYSFANINSLSPDGGVLLKTVFDLRTGTLVRQTPQ